MKRLAVWANSFCSWRGSIFPCRHSEIDEALQSQYS
jgi:hypothetical protein